MPVSRETVLYYDPRGGEQTAVLKSILVQMGARIKNVAPEAVGQTVAACSAAKALTRAKTRKPPRSPSRCSCWTVLTISGSRSCCVR